MSPIRPVRPDDAAAIAGLTTQLGYPVHPATLGRRLAPLLGDPDGTVLVAVDDADHPIGWVHVARTRLLQADDRALLHGLVVADEHRSVGVGAALLEGAERWALNRGIGTMLVRSRSTREQAHRFYREHGYVETKLSHVFEKPLR